MALPAAIALSGLNQEYFSDGLNDVFSHGAVLLKSPSMSSVVSSSSQASQESGISSMSSESSVVKNLAPYFELLFKTKIELKTSEHEEVIEDTVKSKPGYESKPIPPEEEPKPVPKPKSPTIPREKIIYENRNILDLGSNLQGKWNCQSAVIRPGPAYFFENRSQFSRVWGTPTPQPVMVPCNYIDCRFEEPQY